MNQEEARNRAKQLNRSDPHGIVYVADTVAGMRGGYATDPDGDKWLVRTRGGKVVER